MPSISSLLASSALATLAVAVNPIEVKNQELVDSKSGDRFSIIGIDYQPGGEAAYGAEPGDPLSNGTLCLRDAALFQQLGVNTIRSYNLKPELNHDECMSIFNYAGIYVILDVNSPLSGDSIDRSDPQGSYNKDYLTRIFSVVQNFIGYPNVLAFLAGNEVVNEPQYAKTIPPYIRAVQRDLKQYIKAHGDRTIPVGYSAADVLRDDTWAYLQCNNGDDGESSSDFFGLNSYSWCGSGSSYTTSGYDQLQSTYSQSSIPVFFTEYGCVVPHPRVFDEVPVLYSSKMSALSGGLVYQWTNDIEYFGLVSYNDNGTCTLLPDFETLQSQYNKIDIDELQSKNDTATSIDPPKCDSSLISDGQFSTEFDAADAPDGASDMISNGVSVSHTGKTVSVTKTKVTVAVYATNGAEIEGLKITSVSGANQPGHGGGISTAATSGSPSSSSSSSGGSDSSSSSCGGAAVPTMHAGLHVGAVGAAILGYAALL